jgi:hypothetical protein
LAKLGPDADVNSLEPLDLISLTKVLAEATDKMAYLKGRDHFPHQDIAKIASEDAYELWGDTEE